MTTTLHALNDRHALKNEHLHHGMVWPGLRTIQPHTKRLETTSIQLFPKHRGSRNHDPNANAGRTSPRAGEKSTWLEQEVWTLIRINPEQLPTGAFSMVPTSRWRRMVHTGPNALTAEAHWHHSDTTSTYHLSYIETQRSLSITIEKTFPYAIVSWKETGREAITAATLTGRIHSPYWELNGPNAGHEQRKQLGY